MDKINFFDPPLGWINGHCGCVELVEYIPFDYLHVAVGFCIKKLYFFKLLDRQAHATVPACYIKLVLQYPF